jgi:thymidylate synthase (FAD)
MALDSISVLDHGSVKLVESWGSDAAIIEAARMSTDKGFLGWGRHHPHCNLASVTLTKEPCVRCGEAAGDEKLLKYLYTHKHMSPFEMAGAIFEIQAPIFVFREWHR